MGLGASILGAAALMAMPAAGAAATLSTSTCSIPNTQYHHVVYIQLDNQHLSRDNPDVPSDLEQVPALKNFLSGNGTLLDDEHTPLISHTADDIVTSLTGLYPPSGAPVAFEPMRPLRALPGLCGAAVGAADRRGDGRLEHEAALAGVDGVVLRRGRVTGVSARRTRRSGADRALARRGDRVCTGVAAPRDTPRAPSGAAASPLGSN